MSRGIDWTTIRLDLRSPSAEKRGRAMQSVVLALRKNSELAAVALPIFRSAIETETDAWTATSAVRGLELILGPDVVRPAWQLLLTRPNAVFASRLALAADHPSHVPLLLQLLATRAEIPFRSATIRTLGRSKNPAALQPLIDQLAEPTLRVDVVQALEDLGDPQAIPALLPLIDDRTEVGREDDHGGMVYLADLARMAIRRLDYIKEHA